MAAAERRRRRAPWAAPGWAARVFRAARAATGAARGRRITQAAAGPVDTPARADAGATQPGARRARATRRPEAAAPAVVAVVVDMAPAAVASACSARVRTARRARRCALPADRARRA